MTEREQTYLSMIPRRGANCENTALDRAGAQVVQNHMVGNGEYRVVVCPSCTPYAAHGRDSGLARPHSARTGRIAGRTGIENNLFEVSGQGGGMGDKRRGWRVGFAATTEILLLELGSLDELRWDFGCPLRLVLWMTYERRGEARGDGRTGGARETFLPAEDLAGVFCDLDIVDEVACVVDSGGKVVGAFPLVIDDKLEAVCAGPEVDGRDVRSDRRTGPISLRNEMEKRTYSQTRGRRPCQSSNVPAISTRTPGPRQEIRVGTRVVDGVGASTARPLPLFTPRGMVE